MNKNSECEIMGELLKIARLRCGLSIDQVVAKGLASKGYISNLENGKIKEPSFRKVVMLCGLYGLAIDEVMNVI